MTGKDGGATTHPITAPFSSSRITLARAREVAAGADVRIGGGVATVRQYLAAGLIDELHFAVAPVLLGRGENVFAGLDLPKLGYRVSKHVPTEHATHLVLTKAT